MCGFRAGALDVKETNTSSHSYERSKKSMRSHVGDLYSLPPWKGLKILKVTSSPPLKKLDIEYNLLVLPSVYLLTSKLIASLYILTNINTLFTAITFFLFT